MQRRRFLQAIVQDAPDINDDVTRDQTCKEYMNKFLNGTTDFKDECHGMYNAYQAAECSEDTHTAISPNAKPQRRLQDNNSTDDDDDVLIDDFYENWKCCSSIYEYYKTHCNEPELDSQRLLGIVGVLVFCSMCKSFFHQVMGWEWLPDAAVYVLVGATTGGFLKMLAPDVVAERLTFNNDLFLHILLPPIVFQAALKIDKRSFRRDLFPILSFAILGTVVSAVAVGLLAYYLTRLPLLDSLLFGSLVSSIDPVATLGILASVGVSQRDTLYTLIFGESLLNDGVAIVLFDTLVKHLGDRSVVAQAQVMEVLGRFCGIAFGSMVVAMFCGGCCTLYFYNLWGKHAAATEVAIFFSWALIPFYMADMMGGSGIIAIMTMGFFLDYYVVGGNQSDEGEWMEFMVMRCNNDRVRSEGDFSAVGQEPAPPARLESMKLAWHRAFSGRGHILSKSRHHVVFVAEVVGDIMETAIFAYLGLFLFDDDNQWDARLNGMAIVSCVVSRLGMVILISGLINVCVACEAERVLTTFLKKVWSDLNTNTSNNNSLTRNARSEPLLDQYNDDPPTGEEEDDDDDNSTSPKRFLDVKTQAMLVLAGVRGAVSFALVANIPVYNAVTGRGSQFKAELKAMTSCSILFTLFVFGALTYFIVRNEQSDANRERIAGNLTHRLMSMPLASDGEEDDSDALAFETEQLLLEMEAEPQEPPRSILRPS